MIHLDHVSFSYRKKVPVIQDMSLSVQAGEAMGLLGHNGAGKTTTLRLLLGLIHPEKGEVQVNGLSPDAPSVPRDLIAYMPESVGVYEKLTAMQNLVFRARAAGVPLEQYRQTSRDLLDCLGLWKERDETAGLFSKGMKQRLSLACALICSPKVLLLDEPTSGIDPESLSIVVQLLNKERARGTTIICSSHDLASVFDICDRVTILQAGQVVYVGKVSGSVKKLQKKYLELTSHLAERQM